MMSRSKWMRILCVVLCALGIGALSVACKPKKTTEKHLESYYPTSVMNAEKKLTVLGGYGTDNAGRHQFITAEAIQGLLNRDSVKIYVDYPIETEGVSSSAYWLDKIEAYGVTTEEKTLAEAVAMYKAWAGENAGYILYSDETDPEIGTDKTRSLTAATNIAAIRGWLPVDESLQETAEEAWGLTQKLDVRDKDEKWVFEHYRDEFDSSILVQQRAVEIAGLPMVPLRDYAICYKFFTFYEEGTTGSATNFRTAVHQWAKAQMPIFGWGPGDEAAHIGFATQQGQFPIPSDFSMNLTVMNADLFRREPARQKNVFEPVTPKSGKHYVAFGRSDGDNVSVWANTFPLSGADIAGASAGAFPMGWSISPSLAEIAPLILNSVYADASPNDYFIAPVSGHGYMYPSSYPEEDRGTWIRQMDRYLGLSDLAVVEILDSGKGDILAKEIANAYAAAGNLKGGFCLNGNKYAGGQGAVVWSDNGKPFLHPRETLWTGVKEMIAARINSYHTDYTRIEGYTFVNLHPWSHTYQDVQWIVEHLDDDVVVVSPEQMIDMVTRYVPHTDRTTMEDSGEELNLPVDPLYNKFLVNREDWQPVGDAPLTVAGQYLTITGAAQKQWTLPDTDDLWVTFDYKPVGGASATFRVELKIGDRTVSVTDAWPVNGDDGISTFQLPVAAYFARGAYGGAPATLTLTTAGGGVAISNVMTYAKTCPDKTSNGDPFHDTFGQGTIEDWYYGGVFTENGGHEKGGSVKFDNNRIMFDGSDGWTGLYNHNVNTSAVKYLTLPEYDRIRLEMTLQSSDRGTLMNVLVLAGGRLYPLTNGWTYVKESNTYVFRTVINDAAGQPAQILVMQRDSKQNAGIGEAGFVKSLHIDEYVVDPLNNGFDLDLEDWTGTGAAVEDGCAVLDGAASMSKSVALPALDANWKTRFVLTYRTTGSVEYRLVANDGAADVVLRDWQSAVSAEQSAEKLIDEAGALAGRSVTLTLETRGAGKLYLDSFVIDRDWAIDPLNNQFETGMEDWRVKSIVGWGDNGAKKDPGWPRLQITYNDLGNAEVGGQAVLSKVYVLPEAGDIRLDIELELLGTAEIRLEIVVGGQTYRLADWGGADDIGRKTHSVTLAQALQGASFAGEEVEILFTFTADSAHMDAFLWSFVTTAL